MCKHRIVLALFPCVRGRLLKYTGTNYNIVFKPCICIECSSSPSYSVCIYGLYLVIAIL